MPFPVTALSDEIGNHSFLSLLKLSPGHFNSLHCKFNFDCFQLKLSDSDKEGRGLRGRLGKMEGVKDCGEEIDEDRT